MRGDPSLIRSIRGPITLITLGVLFALNNFTRYGFGETWPVLLIVFGLLSLLGRGTETVPPPPPFGYPPQPGYSTNPYPPQAPHPGEPGQPPSSGATR
jgi:cell wall-active antibiotic response 4TMS protein YvqF